MSDVFAMIDAKKRAPKIDPLAAKMRIEEAGKRYLECEQGPRFKVGDWITPVKDGTCQGHGEPHLVIATRMAPHVFLGDPSSSGSPLNGRKIDTRVIQINHDTVCAYWIESGDFEPWECPKA